MPAQQLGNTFFVFDDGLKPGQWSPATQAELAKRVGFDGISFDNARLVPERLKAVAGQSLKMVCLYVAVDVGGGQTVYEPGLQQAIAQLKGHDTLIWLIIRGNGPGAEERATEAARTVAEWAADSGLRVALYPHYGFYVARVEDALRIAEKAQRPNLGVTFNLCHWLRSGDGQNLKLRLQQAMPLLLAVSINGADKNGDSWDRLIQPLDRGDFDVENFVRELVTLGYRGPIGLQCYGIQADPEEHLPRSMAAWRRMSKQIAASAARPR